MQANCRYGPGVAYMWSHGLYPGDTVIIHNRNHDGSWLWIKPDTLNRHCWASEIVMEIEGDVFTVVEYYHPLPHTTFIGPAKNVQASRSGNQVTVTWDPVHYDPDYDLRGYLLEVTLCQNGSRFSTAVHTEGTSYTFTDDADCSGSSSGQLWTAEKHGYTDPVQIPWP